MRARQAEFDAEASASGSIKNRASPVSARAAVTSPHKNAIAAEEEARIVPIGKLATYTKPSGHSFVWFGNKDDDNNDEE